MTKYRDPLAHKEIENTTWAKLNWLRAAVLGANDGIVSTSAIVVGVGAASNSLPLILTASVAGLIAGALSMAVGEYVSVSTQRDSERAQLEHERYELENFPAEEQKELAVIYEKKGLSKETAEKVAGELTARDAFAAHVDAELGIDPNDLTNPLHAAYASGLAFTAGAIIPILAVLLSPASTRVLFTFISVAIALVITGFLSAKTTGVNKKRAVVRVLVGGIIAMLITFGIGKIFGVSGI